MSAYRVWFGPRNQLKTFALAKSVSRHGLIWLRVSAYRVWFGSEYWLSGFGLTPSISRQGLVWYRVSADRVWFGPSGQLSRKSEKEYTDHLPVDTRCAMGEGQIHRVGRVLSVSPVVGIWSTPPP